MRTRQVGFGKLATVAMLLNYVLTSVKVNGHALTNDVNIVTADISDFPTIPAAQIQSDWNESDNTKLDFIKNKPAIPSTTRLTSALTLATVAAGTGSTGGNTGTQISATKASSVRVSYTTQIAYSLGGSVSSSVILKKCATNDPVEANWTACGRSETKQITGLAVTVGQTVASSGQMCADLNPGWFVKAVASGAGTHTETFTEGEQTIYG